MINIFKIDLINFTIFAFENFNLFFFIMFITPLTRVVERGFYNLNPNQFFNRKS